MSDLTVTRTVERWVRKRQQQRVLDEVAVGVAGALWGGTVLLGVLVWLPEWGFLAALGGVLALVFMVRLGLRLRGGAKVDDVALDVDVRGETLGLIRTALAVEGRRASASDSTGAVVVGKAVGRLSSLEPLGAPPVQVRMQPVLLGLMALFMSALFAVAAVIVPMLELPEIEATLPSVATDLDEDEVRALSDAADDLDALSKEPGLDPEARRLSREARDALRAALVERAEARRMAAELDAARKALEQLDGMPLRSARALASSRAEDLAKGLDDALHRGDLTGARRLGEEVLRRTDGGSTDAELRRLGKAIQATEPPPGRAGEALERAGLELSQGERGGALSALADLMAELGEPVRYEARPQALADAEAAVDVARRRALERMDAAEQGERGERSAGDEPSKAPPTLGGPGTTPSPLDMPDRGGEGDGGGGTAKGGTQDLREGGTPGPGDDPEVRADAQQGGDRTEGADADDGRTTPGQGPGREGGAVGAGGPGEGDLADVGGEGGLGDGTGPGSMAGAPGTGAGSGFGQGAGTGSTVDIPLLELDPDTIEQEWLASQWKGAPDAMGTLLRQAELGGRSSRSWGEVQTRYESLAETATRRDAVPLTRRTYIQRYFQAIRPDSRAERP